MHKNRLLLALGTALLLAACGGPPVQDLSLAATPNTPTIAQGSSSTLAVNLTRSNFTGAVNLTTEGLPSGVTATFSPNPATGNTTALKLDVAANVAVKAYVFTVKGGSGNLSKAAALTLTVSAPSASPDFKLSLDPAEVSIVQGAGANLTLSLTRLNGFADPVTLSLEGAPAGVTVAFDPPQVSANTSMLKLTVAGSVPAGNYPLVVKGTAGSLNKTVNTTLTVKVSSYYINPTSGNDANPGTQALPFKTIKHGLSVAVAGQELVLAVDTYNEFSGESWPITIPPQVKVRGSAFGVIFQAVSLNKNGVVFSGDGNLENIKMIGFATAVLATMGSQTLTGLTIEACDYGVFFKNTANGQVKNSTFSNKDGGIYAFDTAQITVQNSTFKNNPTGLYLQDSAKLSMSGGTVEGSSSTGLRALDSTQVTVNGSKFLNNATGVSNSGPDYPTNPVFVLEGVDIQGGSSGIVLNNTVQLTMTSGSIILASSFGMVGTALTNKVKFRGVTIESNKIGLDPDGPIDLGLAADLGNNFIRNNTNTNLYVDGTTSYTLHAVGNTWNPSTQGTDAQGKHSAQLVTGPQTGKNFMIIKNTQKIQF